jgi:hypothetical protein
MSNKSLYQIAGWCALVSVVLTVVAFLMAQLAGEATLLTNVLNPVGWALLLLPVFYALFVVFRSESSTLSLLGLVLAVGYLALAIASGATQGNDALYAISIMVFALPLLIFAYIAYRSAKVPRGLVWVTLLAGVFSLISGAFILGGGTGAVGWITEIGEIVLSWVWLLWLWRWFRSDELALA